MASYTKSFLSFLILCICFSHTLSDDGRKPYIVYMGSLPNEVQYVPSSHHLEILESVLDQSTSPENSLIRSYSHSFNGFAAKLTDMEMQKISRLENVVSVFPDEKKQIQTTRSWNFMGFPQTVQRNTIIESNIIVGVLDTGIWPESESFNDDGFGPIPSKWKGQCPHSTSFPCNKKLIGARNLLSNSSKIETPRDLNGHGTHTASTAAGTLVFGASFYGIAKGTSRGAVPSSRIAAYKICNDQGHCSDSDILSGFDNAIKDGVDILSVSVGPDFADELYKDSIAIGAFHAMENGILTVQAAGNSGPTLSTVASVAPWLFSVAASSIDRHIVSNLVLGNGKTYTGTAINSNTMEQKNHTLVYGKDATSNCSALEGSNCIDGCLDTKLVKGNIVICDAFKRGTADVVIRSGAIGVIISTGERSNYSSIYPLTVAALDEHDYSEVKYYYNQSKTHVGYIHKTETLTDSSAPTVAIFSSRGPNRIAPAILKPDITAPGMNILAAYSPLAHLSSSHEDKRSTNYSIDSGTSMACPHVSGASAYVKSFHPTWSPSAIKSALMTTAWKMYAANNPGGEFGYGAGHIDPVKAVKPGLVYESDTNDYMNFMCKLGYNATMIKLITGRDTTCIFTSNTDISSADLNYPSMAAKIDSDASEFSVEFKRTVTNVGQANSTYDLLLVYESEMEVVVEPDGLSFESVNEKKSFSVRVKGVMGDKGRKTASLTWFNGDHEVRSPIVIYKFDTA